MRSLVCSGKLPKASLPTPANAPCLRKQVLNVDLPALFRNACPPFSPYISTNGSLHR